MQFAGEDFFAKTTEDRVYFDEDRQIMSLSASDNQLNEELFGIIDRYDNVYRGAQNGVRFVADLQLVEVFSQAADNQYQL